MTGLEDPKTIRKLWVGFYVVLGGLALADPKLWDLILGHEEDPHHAAHFVVDGWPEFYVIYGFVACVAMVVVSKKVIGALLMRAKVAADSIHTQLGDD